MTCRILGAQLQFFGSIEAYTDRHNIMLFLMRDTVRDHPVGFDKERRNIFDPEEDQLSEPEAPVDKDAKKVQELNGTENGEESKPAGVSSSRCARVGCIRKPRFDSRFCSDSCEVSALELDLLHSFQESSEIHPSVLRN